jgi:pyruvate/2-oxoglutarate dehydrogenase complex dihydrolipoamide acyltransferase (E2) component
MSWKSSLLILGLVIGVTGAGTGYADAASKQQQAEQARAAQAAKAKKAAAAKEAAAKKAAAAKAEEEKREWYEDDRDKGLDIAAEYAPKQIAKVRKNNYIAKGDTVNTGTGKKGWQQYMDKYYKR